MNLQSVCLLALLFNIHFNQQIYNIPKYKIYNIGILFSVILHNETFTQFPFQTFTSQF